MRYDEIEITVKVPLLGSGMLLCPGSSLLEVAISVHATKDLPASFGTKDSNLQAKMGRKPQRWLPGRHPDRSGRPPLASQASGWAWNLARHV